MTAKAMGDGASQSGCDSGFWPYVEARRLLARLAGHAKERPAVFESGFGPSGFPHLGTMGEVLRPSFVRQALARLDPRRASRLIVFIDDMDGLRKVPENIPQPERLAPLLGAPVSRIFDPFGCCPSFAEHMVGRLRALFAPVEVDYELLRASEMYGAGRFDSGLRLVLERHQEITALVAPTLRAENRAGWSPFMPVCPSCGLVNSTVVTGYFVERESVAFTCSRQFGASAGCGFGGTQSVLGGRAKLQWKVDWAVRWYVLGVDYELYGKDLIDSARLSGQIVRLLGGAPPLGFPFELYLDEQGRKVSKSVGRGVGAEQWLRYAPIDVLRYFLILNPRRARKLFLEAIPQYVDEYLEALRAWSAPAPEGAGATAHRADAAPDGGTPENPERPERAALRLETMEMRDFVWQSKSPRRFASGLTYSLITHLVPSLASDDPALIWQYLTRYDPQVAADPDTEALARTLTQCAINFYNDFIRPTAQFRLPQTAEEQEQLSALAEFLEQNPDAGGEAIEHRIYEIGRRFYDRPGRIFTFLYAVLMGQERGPRLGAFIRLRGAEAVAAMLRRACQGLSPQPPHKNRR